MDVGEKLVELLTEFYGCDPMYYDVDALAIAQHLVSSGVTVQEWIPVTKRLPDLELVDAKSDDFDVYACLVTVKNFIAKNGRYVEKAWYDGDGFIDENYVDITCDVTHWMPLPHPPKGE